jgi:membrane-associated protease RseP (regulator of RpoE activity)
VYGVTEGGPAEKAGFKQYDFITAINGKRVTSRRELTTLLDKFQPGDTVTVTVVRYNNVSMMPVNNGYDSYYGFPFGFGFGGFGGYGNYGYNYGNGGNNGNGNGSAGSTMTNGTLVGGDGYTTLDLNITLEVLDK